MIIGFWKTSTTCEVSNLGRLLKYIPLVRKPLTNIPGALRQDRPRINVEKTQVLTGLCIIAKVSTRMISSFVITRSPNPLAHMCNRCTLHMSHTVPPRQLLEVQTSMQSIQLKQHALLHEPVALGYLRETSEL